MESSTRILIVEDDPDDQDLLRHMLQKARLAQQVDFIGDGQKAIGYLLDPLAELSRLVAVFLDLDLPTLNGLFLLEKIRATDRLRYLPVIVMTSSIQPGDVERCRRLGVSSFVRKPITFSSFASAIGDAFHSFEDTGKLPRMLRPAF